MASSDHSDSLNSVRNNMLQHAQASIMPDVFVKEIALRGFKSFRMKAKIGPLSTFSCIVGPNGSGKSVIGEALAFVLGGSAKSMRAKCLSGLLNEDLRHSDSKRSAKVSVTLEAFKSLQIKISRVVAESTSTYFWKSDGVKRQLSFTELKQELARLGISADVSERFVVMQSRQAVKAKQPSELSEYLEVIFGAGHFERQIKEIEKEISENSVDSTALQERLSELQLKIEKLRPEVGKWQSFNTKWHDFEVRKVSYLKLQSKTLRYRLQQCTTQKGEKNVALVRLKEKKDIVQGLQTRLSVDIYELKILLQQGQRKLEVIEKQHDLSRSKLIKAQVRMSTAKKDANIQEKGRVEISQQQHSINEKMASLSMHLEELEERRKVFEQQKEEFKHEKFKRYSTQCGSDAHDKECFHSSMEDSEDELSEKISSIQGMLKAIEGNIERHTILASNHTSEVHVLERQVTEITKVRENEEHDILAVQEAIRSAYCESNTISSCILPDLKEEFKINKLETYNLNKKFQNFQERVNRNSKEEKAIELLMLKLEGKFHGRLVDLAKVKGNMMNAVNAIVNHVINTSMTLVTEDRETANEVIMYFQDHRIGVVTCEILSESGKAYKSTCESWKREQTGQSVMEYLLCPDIYKPIFWKYIRNWFIVEDRNAAIRYFQFRTEPHRNVVTFKGDIFKQDGEVICAGKNVHGKHLLQGCDTGVLEEVPRTHHLPLEMRNIEERIKNLSEKRTQLKEQILINENKLETLHLSVRELQSQLQKLVEGKRADYDAIVGPLRSRILEKKTAISNIQSALKHLESEAKQHRVVILQLEETRNLYFSPEMMSWSEKMKAVDSDIKKCDLEIRQIKSRMKSLFNTLKKMKISATKVTDSNSPLAEAERMHALAKEQIDNEGIIKAAVESEVKDIKCRLAKMEQELETCKKKAIHLQRKETELQTEVENLTESENELQDKLARVLKVLPDNAEPQSPKRVFQDCRDLSSVSRITSEDDEGIALADEELALKTFHRSIDPNALDEDVKCRKEEYCLVKEIEALETFINSKKLEKESLENERFDIFKRSVKKVNDSLSQIYGELSRHGDAYISFIEEKSLLFIEGVHLQVRPDRQKWCNFSSLSGGQQALAALALSFSLQSQFPSPFYFFDEIDAALDTKVAQMVAYYIKRQQSTQYIIVSHRPQLYEHALTLVGIYHYSGSSSAITATV